MDRCDKVMDRMITCRSTTILLAVSVLHRSCTCFQIEIKGGKVRLN